MRYTLAVLLAVGLFGCGDFVDEDGNTSFRQVAAGLQSFGDRAAELGEALERDADVEAVPWRDLGDAIPNEIDDVERIDVGGDDSSDRNGAGMSVAHGKYVLDGDTLMVGVADLGALRSGVRLALRWATPLLADAYADGDIRETTVDGHTGMIVHDDDGRGVFVALMAENRFVVFAGTEARDGEDRLRGALGEVDYDRLADWADYGR